MLVLCSCLPDPAGAESQQHAWSLLKLVGRSHRVTLAVSANRAVHLAQWRLWSTVADRIELLAPASAHPGIVSRLYQLFGIISRFECLSRRYDAALCSDPQGWPVLRQVHAATRLCDLHGADAATCRTIANQAQVVLISPHQAASVATFPARTVTLVPDHDRAVEIESEHLTPALLSSNLHSRSAASPFNVAWRTAARGPARLAA